MAQIVSMIECCELRLLEIQRRYVWHFTRVRDLLDSRYLGYPSGAIPFWETDEAALQKAHFATAQTKRRGLPEAALQSLAPAA